MSEMFAAAAGAVLSADIAVPDHDREVRFYSRVLRTGNEPLWREDLTSNLGIPVIGIGKRTEAYADLPLQWMPHIQVADVAASARRAVELGGSEVMHAKGDDGQSQWAVLLDPNGAAFGIVPVIPAGAIPPLPEGTDRVGRIAWLDLTVADADATRDFYTEVVGWSVHNVEMKDGAEVYADYGMLRENGNATGGVCHARGANAGLPPVWMIYLPVGDMAESLRIVEEEGGRVIRSVQGADGGYVYAAIQDPVGAYFALMPG